jgi:hypothetical protein
VEAAERGEVVQITTVDEANSRYEGLVVPVDPEGVVRMPRGFYLTQLTVTSFTSPTAPWRWVACPCPPISWTDGTYEWTIGTSHSPVSR